MPACLLIYGTGSDAADGTPEQRQESVTPMSKKRIVRHPILEIPKREDVAFTWNGQTLSGYEGETIASALLRTARLDQRVKQ